MAINFFVAERLQSVLRPCRRRRLRRVTRARFQELGRRSDALLAATSPIYVQDSDGGLEGIGTGLFFKHQGKHFVLSAAHVLRRLKEEWLLIGSDHLIPLNGRYFASKSDDVDLGFVSLSDAQVVELGGAVFLTVNDVDLLDDPETRADGRGYYALGFRADDNAPEGSPASVTSLGSAYLAHAAPPDKYQPLGLSRENHLLFTFDRRVLYSDAGISEGEPEPQGMSGCGVWRFTPAGPSDKLIAILIEHSDTHKVVVSTRLGPLLDGLADHVSGVLI